jgi:hypothetical protein
VTIRRIKSAISAKNTPNQTTLNRTSESPSSAAASVATMSVTPV